MVQIAKQQHTLILRSKWLLSFGLLFACLAIFISYFGQSGDSGYMGFSRMTASLLNLTLLVITFGYGASLVAMYFTAVDVSIGLILTFYLFSLLLAAIFLAIAMVIGLLAKTRFQALGISLMVWAFLVLFYEFLIMGVTLIVQQQYVLSALSISIFLNPVELIRVGAILSLDGTSIFGPSLYELTIWAQGWQGILLFCLCSVLWIVVPLLISTFLMKGRVGNE